MDEARFGQQGTITDVWARTGSRPRAVRQTRYEWVYLYAAVEPATGESAALVAPNVDTGTMNAFLKVLGAERKPGEHFVLVMDQAGWHKSGGVRVAGWGAGLLLPPVNPGVYTGGKLWRHLPSAHLSNPSYAEHDAVLGAGGYVGGPMVLAARTLGIPAALTEADAHLGLANRLAAPFARTVFETYWGDLEDISQPDVLRHVAVLTGAVP